MTTKQKPVRLTISVTPEVHAAFERLSAASGRSMSSCMGEWMADTLDAVQYTADMVERARAAPKQVMREVHAYALGLADETGAVLDSIRGGQGRPKRSAAESEARSLPSEAHIPPSSNTGGKVPRVNPKSSKGKGQ